MTIQNKVFNGKTLWRDSPGTVLTIAWIFTRITYLLTQPRAWVLVDQEYGEFANRFIQSGQLTWQYNWMSHPIPSAMLPPALIFLIVGLKTFFSNHYFAAWAVLQLIVAGATWAIFWTGCCRLLSAPAARLAGALFIFDVNLYSPMRWVNETPFSILFMSMIFFSLIERDRQPSFMKSIVIGASLGLGGLFHASFGIQMVIALGWMLWRSRFNGLGLTKGNAHALLMVSMWILVLTPWTVRNFKIFHRVIPTDIHLGQGLWMGWNPNSWGGMYRIDGSPMGMYEPALIERLKKLQTEPAIDNELKRTSMQYAFENPMRWLRQRVFGFLFFCHEQTFWAPKSPFRTRKSFILGLYNLVLIFGFFACSVTAWRGDFRLRLMMMMMAALCLVHTLILADIGNRYRLPLESFLLITIAYALAQRPFFKNL